MDDDDPTTPAAPHDSTDSDSEAPTLREEFPYTSFTQLIQAKGDDGKAEKALADLCQKYWYPLYAFLRRRGHSEEDSQDLTQGFFASFLAAKSFEGFEPSRGKLRSYLIGALKRIWITGHSLGGAMANLAGARACEQVEIVGIYSFGQPRVGDKMFADTFNNNEALRGRLHRFVNSNDIVPRVPPHFAHVEQCVYFDKAGQLAEPPRGRSLGDGSDSDALSDDEFKAMQDWLELDQGTGNARGMMPPFL